MPYSPDICLYHDPCNDGIAAATVIKHRFPDVDLRPSNYGRDLPLDDAEGKAILFVDFSAPAEVLLPIAHVADSILILDHHKTAREGLAGLPHVVRPDRYTARQQMDSAAPRILCEFDMDRSGAMMAWDFANPGTPPHGLVEAVQDRDLWRFELPHTRAIHLWLRDLPRTFAAWSEAFRLFEEDPRPIIETGHALLRDYEAQVEDWAATATLQDVAGHVVPLVECPYELVSDTCNLLLTRHPDAPFSAARIEGEGGVTYSLRSTDDRMDVSAIARAHGGGGHRNAAGFRLPNHEPDTEADAADE